MIKLLLLHYRLWRGCFVGAGMAFTVKTPFTLLVHSKPPPELVKPPLYWKLPVEKQIYLL
jgi:hypothetical protein